MKEQLITQGRDWMQELILVKNLVRAGVSPEQAYEVAPLLKKANCLPDEEALVKKVWQQVRSQ
jgi:2-phosphoglycerate kinase